VDCSVAGKLDDIRGEKIPDLGLTTPTEGSVTSFDTRGCRNPGSTSVSLFISSMYFPFADLMAALLPPANRGFPYIQAG